MAVEAEQALAPLDLDREVAAVVAHGLLSRLAVLSGCVDALLSFPAN